MLPLPDARTSAPVFHFTRKYPQEIDPSRHAHTTAKKGINKTKGATKIAPDPLS
jgi:hypothetical protein